MSRDPKDHLEPTTGVGSRCTIKMEKRIDDTIITTVTGTVSVALAFRFGLQLEREHGDRPCDLIFDAAGVIAFESEAKEPFAEALIAFKKRQGNLVFVVVDNKSLVIKMMFFSIATLSLHTGGPALEIVPTLHDALVRIRHNPGETDGRP